MNEADTCRKYILPKLTAWGKDSEDTVGELFLYA